MTVDEIVAEVIALLQKEERVSYRLLKRKFDLDDDYIADLKVELIKAKRLAVDEDGKVLVWAGKDSLESSVQSRESKTLPSPDSGLQTSDPGRWTPPHLAERIRAEQAALEARGATDGERKTITALFADLKGSTALIEGLDPEEARSIIDPALQLMMDAVHRYEGYVAQALGDGIFALFGAPIAHEDHPQRALYAALRMQEEMRRYADTLRAKGSPPLLMRVGLNTGEVVVRSIRKDDLHTDYVPVGHSTNLAARMEQLANPGAIVVSAYTHRLTDGYFAFKLLSVSGCLVLEAYSVSHGKASAYLPVIELLKSYFRIEPQDDERTRQEKVGGKVLMLDRNLEDTLPYLFALLGIEEQPSPLQQLGETSQLFPVLWGLLQLYVTRADYRRGREYGEQMLSLAQRVQDFSLLLWAYRCLGEVSFCLGELPAAKAYSENRVALYDPQQRRAQTFAYGEDPAIAAFPFYGMSLFLLGYPDRAQQKSREALTLARELAHANSLAIASFLTA